MPSFNLCHHLLYICHHLIYAIIYSIYVEGHTGLLRKVSHPTPVFGLYMAEGVVRTLTFPTETVIGIYLQCNSYPTAASHSHSHRDKFVPLSLTHKHIQCTQMLRSPSRWPLWGLFVCGWAEPSGLVVVSLQVALLPLGMHSQLFFIIHHPSSIFFIIHHALPSYFFACRSFEVDSDAA